MFANTDILSLIDRPRGGDFLHREDPHPTVEERTAAEIRRLRNALRVVVTNPKIRTFLAENDPQALAQAEAALTAEAGR